MRLLLAALLISSSAIAGPLDDARSNFLQGDFDAALKSLEPLKDERDPLVAEPVHLLRAQCFAARQDFAGAEAAFARALDANPDATLDPTRVDPSVVKLLDGLRARLTGTLEVTGATGVREGNRVLSGTTLPIGTHSLSIFSGTRSQALKVRIFPGQTARIAAVFDTAPAPCPEKPPEETPREQRVFAFGDVRGVSENGAIDGGLEIGLGAGWRWFRLGLAGRVAPNFGIVPRLTFAVPIAERTAAFVEVEVPIAFRSRGIAAGFGGSLGAEYEFFPWLSGFAQAGARYFVSNPSSNVPLRFVATAGVRLRIP